MVLSFFVVVRLSGDDADKGGLRLANKRTEKRIEEETVENFSS